MKGPKRKLVWLLLVGMGLLGSATPYRAETAGNEAVVLLHGLGRTDRSMETLADHLRASGFDVYNLRYPSTREAPAGLVENVAEQVDSCCRNASTLHFVGHSLGGILARAYLADAPRPNAGRLVMLGPPNRGSEIVDALGTTAVFQSALGETAQQLGTTEDSFPNSLPEPAVEVGVIAGQGSINPVGSLILPDEDDGMVTVASTKLDGMKDFLVVPSSHTFMMQSDEVAKQVVQFLRHGKFDRRERVR